MKEILTLVSHGLKSNRHPLQRVTRTCSPYPKLGGAGIWRAYIECSGHLEKRQVVGIGKGPNDEVRQMSAVGEAIERHHFFTSVPLKTARVTELGLPYVLPEHLGLFTDSSYRDSHGYRRTLADTEAAWSLASDIATGEFLYVPHESGSAPRLFYRPTTSGWATQSGSLAEVGALLELIERDALLLSWYCQDFGVELVCVDMLAPLTQIGVSVRLFCVTKDIRIPVVWAWASLQGFSQVVCGGSLFSSAAAMDLRTAMRSAVDGIIQKLESLDAGIEEQVQTAPGVPQHQKEHILYYLDTAHRHELASVVGSPPREDCQEVASTFLSPAESVDFLPAILSRLKEFGFRALAVDETQPYARDLDLRVVRAVVPGLLPMSFGPSSAGRISLLRQRAHDGVLADSRKRLAPSLLPPHPFA